MTDRLKTCRVCLHEVKNIDEIYEFSAEVAIDVNSINFVKIRLIYSDISGIDIVDEELNKICSGCLGDLKFCYLFKKKCLDAAKSFDKENEPETIEEYCIIDEEDSDNLKSEPTNDPCFIEYVEEEELMGENEQDDLETEEESDSKTTEKPQKTKITDQDGVTYSCDVCAKIFDRKEYYRRHYRRAHLNQIIEERTGLDKSSDVTSQVELFQCICGKISVTREEYDTHQLEHQGEARFKCRKCDQTFSSKEVARKHLNSAHSTEEKPFNCENCPKSFKNRYQLILHNRSHTGEKPFRCPICEKGFSMSSNLQKHLDTHSSEKPYQCGYCGQYFKTQRSLKFHTVCYHQPEAKVKCSYCDKSFVNKSYLKMHMLYHTGEKNFTCTICNSKYYKSSHLKRHIQNVHFKLRLMKCEFCTSDFVRKETYKAHIMSHHKRHLSDQELEEVLEKIRKFQPPALDIDQFTLEKQKGSQEGKEQEEGEIDMEEMIEEHMDDEIEKPEEGMIIETNEEEYPVELFEEDEEEHEELS